MLRLPISNSDEEYIVQPTKIIALGLNYRDHVAEAAQVDVKGFNAEQAGAVAVFMVNDGRCSDFPNGPDCVLNMGPGALGGLVTIPMALVSVTDGAPIVDAVEGGATVSGAYGTHVHAVVRNAKIPSDSLHFTRENDLIGGALTPKDGLVTVPDAPGLGVELDMAAVEKYRVG